MRAALYARFSTDRQRDTSIEDQFRECERAAKQAGLKVVKRFKDEAISSGTARRPGYQAMLTAARAHEFDIIVTEDIERLWRNRAEFGPRSAELEDLGVHCLTCTGDDTRRDGWGLVIQIKQAVGEHARRQASYRTRRGQEGVFLAGKATGGRAYGYTPATGSKTGQVEIEDAEAAVVRRVFMMYADGMSSKKIAATLNEEGVPSPGAKWKRTQRRTDGKWLSSAIHGDTKRGTGILNNARYTGRITWGRSEWKRSAADSAKRRMTMKDTGQERIDERLRIIPDELWQRVKARQGARSRDTGERVKGGLRVRRPGSGPRHQYLLSGLLHCGECGAALVMASKERYQCASHVNGGNNTCSNSLSVERTRVERRLLDCLSAYLSDTKNVDEVERKINGAKQPAVDYAPAVAKLEKQVANMTDAIANGLVSPALSEKLREAEGDLAALRIRAAVAKPAGRPSGSCEDGARHGRRACPSGAAGTLPEGYRDGAGPWAACDGPQDAASGAAFHAPQPVRVDFQR
jgi:site-specific DNA recombinase